jgi:hypothetical protein
MNDKTVEITMGIKMNRLFRIELLAEHMKVMNNMSPKTIAATPAFTFAVLRSALSRSFIWGSVCDVWGFLPCMARFPVILLEI